MLSSMCTYWQKLKAALKFQIITFIDTDEGTSITNASEQLANEIRGKAKHPNIRYFERYIGKPELWNLTTYDEIRYTETNGKLHSPVWESLTEEAYHEIVESK